MRRKKPSSRSVRVEKTVGKASGKVQLYGWLDRRRHVLEILEETIENARRESQAKTGRGHDNSSRLEWSKTLMRLLELYDLQLETIKRHIYGSSAPGAGSEPGEETNGLIVFERDFQHLVQERWGPDDLKLECEDCGIISEDVYNRNFPGEWVGNELTDDEELELCDKCYEKRTDEASR